MSSTNQTFEADDPWQVAKLRLLDGLDLSERQLFENATLENLYYFTSNREQIDAEDDRTRYAIRRLEPLVSAIESYGSALDTFAHPPLHLAPIWGSIRVLLVLAKKHGRCYEQVLDTLSRIGDILPRFRDYQRIYDPQNHQRLAQALSNAYLAIIVLCTEWRKSLLEQKTSLQRVTKSLLSNRLNDAIERFWQHRENVREEAKLCNQLEDADKQRELLLTMGMGLITKENNLEGTPKLPFHPKTSLAAKNAATIDPSRESPTSVRFHELKPDDNGYCIAYARAKARPCRALIRQEARQLAARLMAEFRINNPKSAPSTEELAVLAQLMLCPQYHRHPDLATKIADAWTKELSVPFPLKTPPIEDVVSMSSTEAIIRHREEITSEAEFKMPERSDKKNIVSTIVRYMKNLRSVPEPAGYIYMFYRSGTPSMIKIGITRYDPEIRFSSIAETCHYEPKVIYHQPVYHPRDIEGLVQISLLKQRREEESCNAGKGCGLRHLEWFEVDHEFALLTIKRWAEWISITPYTSAGLDPFWRTNLFEAEQLPSLHAFNQWIESMTQNCIQNGEVSWRGRIDGQFHTAQDLQEFLDIARPSSPISLASLIFSDVPSLVSDTGSSMLSDSSISSTVEEFSALLLEDEAIRWLQVVAFERFGPEKFAKNISRLLREYANDLQADIVTDYEGQAVRFVQVRAHRIAKSLQNQIQPEMGRITKELDNLSSQALETREMLDRFNQEPAQSYILDHNLKALNNHNSDLAHRDLNSYYDDSEDVNEHWVGLDESETDDIEPSESRLSLPYIGLIKEFMVTSEAYEKLHDNLRDLVLPSKKQQVRETTEVEDKSSLQVIGVSSTSLHQGEPRNDLKVAAIATELDHTNNDFTLDVSTKVLPGYNDHAVTQEKKIPDHVSRTYTSRSTTRANSYTNTKNEKAVFQLNDLNITTMISLSKWKQGYSGLRKWAKVRWNWYLRPRVEHGYRRIEWTCDCGEELYGDFDNSNQQAVNELAATLLSPASDSLLASEGCSEQVISRQSSSSIAASTEYKSAPCTSTSATSESGDSQRSPTPIITSVATEILVPQYVALCINTGGIPKTLTEVDVSDAVSDAEVFERLRTSYNKTRGYRTRFSFLIHPIAVQFVKFNLFSLRHGYVAVYETEKSYSIPSADVREYRYSPVPLHDPPPMPPEAFLHYLKCADTEDCHKARFWVNRIPKRLKKRIIDVPNIPVCGWGIYIQEGPNKSAVFWIVMVTTFAGVLASVLWSCLRGDIQGGMGLGSVILALPSIIMAAFLYKLTAE